MSKREEKIIHVHLKKSKKNYYFGSISAIFTVLAPEQIGVSKKKDLYIFDIDENKPFNNELCTIRKGSLVRLKTNRRNPIKQDLDKIIR